MADLMEAVAERLVYKRYSSAVIDPSSEPSPASDPAATGGQILRYRSHNLSLGKESFSADEMRTDQQRPMPKEGTRRVPVSLQHLLSCLTYKDQFEDVLRGTWTSSAITKSNTEFTSCAADSATTKFTMAGGDPVAEGLRVGDPFQLGNMSNAANNGRTFIILAFGGASNRDITVYPAPTTQTADTSFTLTTVGRSLIAPASSPVKRKCALEVYNPDADIARLWTEIRLSGFGLSLAPDQMAQLSFTGMGRNRKTYSGVNAPFFSSPTAETTKDVIGSMDGVLLLNGAVVAVLSALQFQFNRAPTAPAQLQTKGLPAGISQGAAVGSGEFTAFLQDTTFLDLFDDPTTLKAQDFSLLAYLPASDAAAPQAMTIFLPRVKLNSNQESVVENVKALQCGFDFARYLGSAAGVESTSVRICDTEVS